MIVNFIIPMLYTHMLSNKARVSDVKVSWGSSYIYEYVSTPRVSYTLPAYLGSGLVYEMTIDVFPEDGFISGEMRKTMNSGNCFVRF